MILTTVVTLALLVANAAATTVDSTLTATQLAVRDGTARRNDYHARLRRQETQPVTWAWKRGDIPLHPDGPLQGAFVEATVGGKVFHLQADPYGMSTVIDGSVPYSGGTKTKFTDKRGGIQVTVYKDKLSVAGFDVPDATIAAGTDRIWIKGYEKSANGILGFESDAHKDSMATTLDPSLTGLHTALKSAGQYVTMKIGGADIAHLQGTFSIDKKEPAFWVNADIPNEFGFKAGKLNGVDIQDVWLAPGIAIGGAPESVITKLFADAGLKAIQMKDEASGKPTVRAEVDCQKGWSMKFELGGQTIEANGPATVVAAPDGNKCYAAMQSAEYPQTTIGWSIYEAAAITFDPAQQRVGFTPNGGGGGGGGTDGTDSDAQPDTGAQPSRRSAAHAGRMQRHRRQVAESA